MNKLKKIQLVRIIIQIGMFFLLPGIYFTTFSELKEIYKMILTGNFNFLQAFPGLIKFSVVILFAILTGRFFCGWFCGFGMFNDFIYIISKKVFKTGFKVNEKLDSILKYVKYVVLLTVLIVTCNMGSTLLNSTSPWDAFAQITDFRYVLTNLTIGFILLALITIGSFFIERFFCRYLCPLGAVFSLVSRVSLLKIGKPSEKCGSCRICTNNCSMGLKLYKSECVSGGDCINCLKCIEECHRKNIHLNIIGEDVNPALAGSVAIAAFAGIYGLSSVGGNLINQSTLGSSKSVSSNTLNTPSQKYKDGTYTGTGTGFRGGTTKVEITIASGRISNISTLSHEDTPDFYERAFAVEPKEIISAQSTSVDVVSGATFSSYGIINAVEDALNKALVNTAADKTISDSDMSQESSSDILSEGNKDENDENNKTGINEKSTKGVSSEDRKVQNNEKNKSAATGIQREQNTTKSAVNNNSNTQKYKDGTYTGNARGFRRGITKIEVTIKNGRISDISTISHGDTPDFYERAFEIEPKEIISAQSTLVDAVSGATFSSYGIMNAVQDALSKALINNANE